MQGVNTPEKAAGEGSLEKGLKNVGSKFSTIEQLVAQGAETVKERNGILPAEIIKGVSAVAVLRGPGRHNCLQPASSRGDDGRRCVWRVCLHDGCRAFKAACTLRPQDAQREMDDAEEYLAKVEKQYANKRL